MTRLKYHDVLKAKQRFVRYYDNLPDHSNTDKQYQLTLKHGTPRDFARACCLSIGEISIDECDKAVADYMKEWTEAGL